MLIIGVKWFTKGNDHHIIDHSIKPESRLDLCELIYRRVFYICGRYPRSLQKYNAFGNGTLNLLLMPHVTIS